MGLQKSAAARLNQGHRIFFFEFVRVSLRQPAQALFFARTVLWQRRAARLRARLARQGVQVPPSPSSASPMGATSGRQVDLLPRY